jgi:hypothetical protein
MLPANMAGGFVKVFISWSGQVSRPIAQAIYGWLPSALQNVKPWFSDEIEKGANWQASLFAELEDTKFSLVVLTREALKSDWIMFETGAAAKAVGKSHACPILFGLEKAEVSGPLSSFQLTQFDQGDFFKLFKTINNALCDAKLDDMVLASVFNNWWPDLEAKVKDILSKTAPQKAPRRDMHEMVEETLLLVRGLQNTLEPGPTRDERRFIQNYRNAFAHRSIQTDPNTTTVAEMLKNIALLFQNELSSSRTQDDPPDKTTDK